MRISYKRIVIEGFQSFAAPLKFDLSGVGITLVKGVNGAGKSTLFNAIYWVEYGGNLKKTLQTWEEQRPSTWRGTRVVIDRTDGTHDYRIARHIKYKGKTSGLLGADKLMLFKKKVSENKFTDSHLLGEGLHKSDMQEMIVQQLGLDEQTYTNSIFFGQAQSALITAPNADKRKLFEELFKADFVDSARDKAKIKYQELEKSIDKYKYAIDRLIQSNETIEDKISRREEVLRTYQEQKDKKILDISNRLEKYTTELEEERSTYKKLVKKLESLDISKETELEEAVEEANTILEEQQETYTDNAHKILNYESEVVACNRKISGLEEQYASVDTTCPACEQLLPKKAVAKTKENIQAAISKEQEVVAKITKELAQYNKKGVLLLKAVNAAKKVKNKAKESLMSLDTAAYYDCKGKLDTSKQLGKEKKRAVDDLTARLTEEKNSELKIEEFDIDKATEEIKLNKKEITRNDKNIKKEESYLAHTDWWVKKGFGASGIKSFIFNSMLSQLNTSIAGYCSRLGFEVVFSVDMEKASKPFQTTVYKDGIARDYDDLSGGQKQRVNICVGLAMHDLVSYKSDISLLIMDEFTDALDNEGIEVFFDLVRLKAANKKIFIITHSDIIDSVGCGTVNVGIDNKGNSILV